MKGDTEKNRLLTEARAMAVRYYLVQNFMLDDTRIKTIGQGSPRTRMYPEQGALNLLTMSRP
jgi:outer membrane protein OmpA-like peptidoglycan-associated protein